MFNLQQTKFGLLACFVWPIHALMMQYLHAALLFGQVWLGVEKGKGDQAMAEEVGNCAQGRSAVLWRPWHGDFSELCYDNCMPGLQLCKHG